MRRLPELLINSHLMTLCLRVFFKRLEIILFGNHIMCIRITSFNDHRCQSKVLKPDVTKNMLDVKAKHR